eukprot:COSAG05_NODE_1605_length_4417_cov_8.763780_2_plen_51_part_00
MADPVWAQSNTRAFGTISSDGGTKWFPGGFMQAGAMKVVLSNSPTPQDAS